MATLQRNLKIWQEDLERTLDQHDMEGYAFASRMCSYYKNEIAIATATA